MDDSRSMQRVLPPAFPRLPYRVVRQEPEIIGNAARAYLETIYAAQPIGLSRIPVQQTAFLSDKH